MSPRAACRLELLGFTQVYDYVLGKADWLAQRTGVAQVHDARGCALDDVDVHAPSLTDGCAGDHRIGMPVDDEIEAQFMLEPCLRAREDQ